MDRTERRIEAPDGSAEYLWSPGFIDLQVNGVDGFDYSSTALNHDGVEAIVRGMARYGTAHHLATIITNPQHTIVQAIRTIVEARSRSEMIRDTVIGIHVEGPFISPDDGPRGAHDRAFVRNPDLREYEEWMEASDGLLRMVTIAPERPGALALIRRMADDGVIVAIGHTAADATTITQAVDAGARFSTHLGNGAHPTMPGARFSGYLMEQLAGDALTASIIADGYHLTDSFIRVVSRVKPPGRLVLVSDIAPLAGCAAGTRRWGNTAVEVHADGHLSVAGQGVLAGAGFGLDTAIGVFRRASGWSLAETLELVTTVPRTLLFPHGNWNSDSLTVFKLHPTSTDIEIVLTANNDSVAFLKDSDLGVTELEGRVESRS